MQDETFLRQAIALARIAREQGEDPFGAVLVRDGKLLHGAHDRSLAWCDPTAHAEMVLIREYCERVQAFSLEGCTLYASAEPCVMCAGGIKWARIDRVVFSVSQAMLQTLSGGKPKPACAEILNTGGRRIEVVGPLLPEEGLAVFEGYVFESKASRHRARQDTAHASESNPKGMCES